MAITITAKSDIGRNRTHNEDRVWVSPSGNAVAVLDASGGGGEAADIVISALAQGSTMPAASTELVALVRDLDHALATAVSNDPRTLRVTTLDLMVFTDDHLAAVHVGDGRMYRVRDGMLEQLSTDHTLVAEMVAREELRREDARTDPRRTVITRALTGGSAVEPETLDTSLRPGDRYIICTDGVWRAVSDASLADHFTAGDASSAIDAVLRLAQESNDNVTVAVVDIS